MATSPKIIAVLGYDQCWGAEKANLQVLKSLKESGAQVHCLVRQGNAGKSFRKLAEDSGLLAVPAAFGPNIFGLHFNIFRYFSNLVGMLRVSVSLIILTTKKRATHIYIPNYLQFLYCWPALQLLRLPVVFRLGDIPEQSILHRKLWTWVIAPRVNQFVANSEYTRQRLRSVCNSPTKSRVIKNSIECQLAGNARMSNFLPRQPRTITYLGQMHSGKGVHFVVEAALELCKSHDDLCFQLVGLLEPTSNWVQSLIEKIEREDMENRITFRPYVADVRKALEGSMLHLCPSPHIESSANVVLDAKRQGVPSVVFPTGGLPELVEHQVDGYVCESADVSGLLRGIQFFLDNPSVCKSASRAARLSIVEHTPAVVGPQWRRVFDECAAG